MSKDKRFRDREGDDREMRDRKSHKGNGNRDKKRDYDPKERIRQDRRSHDRNRFSDY